MRKVLCFSAIVVMTVGFGALGCMDGLSRLSPPKSAQVPNGASTRESISGGNVKFPDVPQIDATEETQEDL
jgi:hypothetical protein